MTHSHGATHDVLPWHIEYRIVEHNEMSNETHQGKMQKLPKPLYHSTPAKLYLNLSRGFRVNHLKTSIFSI